MPDEKRWKILIIDDDPLVLKSFISLLNFDGYLAVGVSTVSRALKALERDSFDIVLTELIMEEMGSEKLLSAIFQRAPGVIVMVLTGYGSLQMAMQAMHKGAYDFILKPCDYNVLKLRIDRAIKEMRILEGQKKAELGLRESEDRYRIVVENIHDLLLLLDEDKNCLYASPSWETQFGLSLSSLVGKNWIDLLTVGDRKRIERAFQSLSDHRDQNQEFEIQLCGNNNITKTFKGYMLSPKSGLKQKPLIFLLLHDITEHLKIQEQEREIERIKAAKDLAIATAHHINQPITCVRGLTEIMLKEPKERHVVLEYLEQILIQCDIVQDITEKLQKIDKYETEPYMDEEMLKILESE